MTLRQPPSPFEPQVEALAPGTLLYRVYSNSRQANEFNSGIGSPTRFAFFGEPAVPVLYAATSEIAAVCETLLHDIPPGGGLLRYDDYRAKVMGRVQTTRQLRLAAFDGTGLRRGEATAGAISASGAATYDQTLLWAEAAHEAGLDGLAWISKKCPGTKAYVFFGDRCEDAFTQDPSFGRMFAAGLDQFWLIDVCAPLHVDVLLRA